MPDPMKRIASGLATLCLLTAVAFAAQEWKSGVDWREPTIITPGDGTAPPSDAIVLFDGTNLDAWAGVENWEFKDGYGVVGSNIVSKQKFGDCQLHLEFATPEKVEGEGQGRGNSGVYFMGKYEVQILDSYDNTTYYDGQCGSLYKQHPPLVNCCRKPGEWQAYDIIFTAPRFHADGSLKSPAFVTALQNGVLVQNHYQLQGPTDYIQPPRYSRHPLRESLKLQYHNNPTRFRNIWIRDLMADAEPSAVEQPSQTAESNATEDAATSNVAEENTAEENAAKQRKKAARDAGAGDKKE